MSMIISAVVSRDIIIKLLGWHGSLFCLNLVKQPSACHMEQCLSQKTVFVVHHAAVTGNATGNKAGYVSQNCKMLGLTNQNQVF